MKLRICLLTLPAQPVLRPRAISVYDNNTTGTGGFTQVDTLSFLSREVTYAKAEITRLKPSKAYITSGTAVIKPAVISELKSMGITPIELGGYDQYETSVNIAGKMQSLGADFTKIVVVAG